MALNLSCLFWGVSGFEAVKWRVVCSFPVLLWVLHCLYVLSPFDPFPSLGSYCYPHVFHLCLVVSLSSCVFKLCFPSVPCQFALSSFVTSSLPFIFRLMIWFSGSWDLCCDFVPLPAWFLTPDRNKTLRLLYPWALLHFVSTCHIFLDRVENIISK